MAIPQWRYRTQVAAGLLRAEGAADLPAKAKAACVQGCRKFLNTRITKRCVDDAALKVVIPAYRCCCRRRQEMAIQTISFERRPVLLRRPLPSLFSCGLPLTKRSRCVRANFDCVCVNHQLNSAVFYVVSMKASSGQMRILSEGQGVS